METVNNLTTIEGVKKHMSESTSEKDWNRRCDDVKAANDGYPQFWYVKIIMSGLAAKAQANW